MKTSVDGNRVTIDDSVYRVSPAGTDQYAVSDDFGEKLGYFAVRGQTVKPEDYGIPGAHPVAQIGRLWVAANLAKSDDKNAAPPTKGVCRIVTHERPDDGASAKARAYRAWMRKLPGCKASYYVLDPESGKALSISIWAKAADLDRINDADAPAGSAALPASTVELFPFVEEP